MSRHLSIVLLALTGVLISCTWVKPIDATQVITLRKASEVGQCANKGTTTSSVRDQIGWFNRNEEKVADELLTLAKNSSLTMGGNTLVATAPPKEGSQTFVVYSCP